jgi:hypothetical protein
MCRTFIAYMQTAKGCLASIKNHSRTRTHRHRFAVRCLHEKRCRVVGIVTKQKVRTSTNRTGNLPLLTWHCSARVRIVAFETQQCILYVMSSYMWQQCKNIVRCATLIRQLYSILRSSWKARDIFVFFLTKFGCSRQTFIQVCNIWSHANPSIGSLGDRCVPTVMAKITGASWTCLRHLISSCRIVEFPVAETRDLNTTGIKGDVMMLKWN